MFPGLSPSLSWDKDMARDTAKVGVLMYSLRGLGATALERTDTASGIFLMITYK